MKNMWKHADAFLEAPLLTTYLHTSCNLRAISGPFARNERVRLSSSLQTRLQTAPHFADIVCGGRPRIPLVNCAESRKR